MKHALEKSMGDCVAGIDYNGTIHTYRTCGRGKIKNLSSTTGHTRIGPFKVHRVIRGDQVESSFIYFFYSFFRDI
jgi:hypothetical protein